MQAVIDHQPRKDRILARAAQHEKRGQKRRADVLQRLAAESDSIVIL